MERRLGDVWGRSATRARAQWLCTDERARCGFLRHPRSPGFVHAPCALPLYSARGHGRRFDRSRRGTAGGRRPRAVGRASRSPGRREDRRRRKRSPRGACRNVERAREAAAAPAADERSADAFRRRACQRTARLSFKALSSPTDENGPLPLPELNCRKQSRFSFASSPGFAGCFRLLFPGAVDTVRGASSAHALPLPHRCSVRRRCRSS